MSKKETVPENVEPIEKKPKKGDPVLLNKVLLGWDKTVIQSVDEDELGKRTRSDMTIRSAILSSLKFGGAMAAQEKTLSEKESIRCDVLGMKISNEESSGCTLKPEDIVLIKKLAKYRLTSPELYWSLIRVIDPTAQDE